MENNLPAKRHAAVAPTNNTIIGNPARILYLLFPPVVFIIVVAAAFKPSCDSQAEKIGAVASGYYVDKDGIEHEAENVLDAYVQQTISEAETAKEVLTDPFQESPPKKSEAAPQAATKEVEPIKAAYVKRYAAAAKSVFRKTGIPASITLAQALVEGNAGQSKLATQANNHFGIKYYGGGQACDLRNGARCSAWHDCSRSTCVKLCDDSCKDRFKKFKSVADCFTEHAKMLQKERYAPAIKKYGRTKNGYIKIAYALDAAGYATDKRYAEKLIGMIERYQLYKYDK